MTLHLIAVGPLSLQAFDDRSSTSLIFSILSVPPHARTKKEMGGSSSSKRRIELRFFVRVPEASVHLPYH
ncbi:uncharacterized protein J3R85_016131 [Psidium guajava]|nr:uncharacterized protein J3R85_016131 [Psidium guajava]